MSLIILDTGINKHRLLAASERPAVLNELAGNAGWNDIIGEFIDRTAGADRAVIVPNQPAGHAAQGDT